MSELEHDAAPMGQSGRICERMLAIKSLHPAARLEFSEYTRKWYVSASIEISTGVLLGGITEHRDTADDAVDAYWQRLTEITTSTFDRVLVTRAYSDERREWRWNGGGFVEVTGEGKRLAERAERLEARRG